MSNIFIRYIFSPETGCPTEALTPKKVTKHQTPPKSVKEENQAYAEASIQLRDVLTLSSNTNTFVSYQDVVRAILSLLMCSCVAKKLGIEVHPSPGLILSAWEEKLENDRDKEFILNGI